MYIWIKEMLYREGAKGPALSLHSLSPFVKKSEATVRRKDGSRSRGRGVAVGIIPCHFLCYKAGLF